MNVVLQQHGAATILVSGHDVPGEAEVKIAHCLHELLVRADGGDGGVGAAHEKVLIVGEDADLLLLASCVNSHDNTHVCVLPKLPQLVGRGHVWHPESCVCRAQPHGPRGMGRDAAVIAVLEAGNDYLPPVRDLKIGQLWATYMLHMCSKATRKPQLVSERAGIKFGRLVKLINKMMQDQAGQACGLRSSEGEFLWAPGGHSKMFDVENYIQVIMSSDTQTHGNPCKDCCSSPSSLYAAQRKKREFFSACASIAQRHDKLMGSVAWMRCRDWRGYL